MDYNAKGGGHTNMAGKARVRSPPKCRSILAETEKHTETHPHPHTGNTAGRDTLVDVEGARMPYLFTCTRYRTYKHTHTHTRISHIQMDTHITRTIHRHTHTHTQGGGGGTAGGDSIVNLEGAQMLKEFIRGQYRTYTHT